MHIYMYIHVYIYGLEKIVFNYSDIIPTLFKDYLSLDIFISKSNRLARPRSMAQAWEKLSIKGQSRWCLGCFCEQLTRNGNLLQFANLKPWPI